MSKWLFPMRSYSIIKFSDESFMIDWKIKNLSSFLRNLYNNNKVLQSAWADRFETAEEFAVSMGMKAGYQLNYTRENHNNTTANLYLFPRGHAYYKKCYATITRFYPTKGYEDNTLTTKKFKR